MPLGDPHGANFEYTVEGLPLDVFQVVIPVSDPRSSSEFYTDILRMETVSTTRDEVVVRRAGCMFRLRRSDRFGIDTGIYISVSSPYDFRRRMVDEGVEFVMPPTGTPFGVTTSFRDYDGNILYAVEAQPTEGNNCRTEVGGA